MPTLITAHTGSDGFPANSLPFIRALCSAGAAAIELDIRKSADGQLYLAHDPCAPSVYLRDALDILAHHHGCLLNADIKEPALEQQTLLLAQEYGVQSVLSGTVSLANIPLKQRSCIFYNLEQDYDYRHNHDEAQLSRTLVKLYQEGIETIQMDHHYLTPAMLDQIKKSGLRLSLWTAADEAETQRLLTLGVANITTMTALPFI